MFQVMLRILRDGQILNISFSTYKSYLFGSLPELISKEYGCDWLDDTISMITDINLPRFSSCTVWNAIKRKLWIIHSS